MVVDSTLTFAARRNIPVRYNRDHITTTLKAMERVQEIRTRRERAFYKQRMSGNKERQRAADRKLVEENQHLLPRQRASERRAELELENKLEGLELPEETVKESTKQKIKQRLLVGGGEEMDVD